jgi:hypothetical protein
VIVAQVKNDPHICLEGLRKHMRTLGPTDAKKYVEKNYLLQLEYNASFKAYASLDNSKLIFSVISPYVETIPVKFQMEMTDAL